MASRSCAGSSLAGAGVAGAPAGTGGAAPLVKASHSAAAQHLGRDAVADGGLAHGVEHVGGHQAAGGGQHRLVAGDALDRGALGLGADGLEVGRRRRGAGRLGRAWAGAAWSRGSPGAG